MPYHIFMYKEGTGSFNWMSNFNLGGYSGGTYYVDGTNGNDSNPGTEAQPWASIHEVKDRSITNAALVIKPGTYVESRSCYSSYLQGAFCLPSNTTLIAETPGTVILRNGNDHQPTARDANLFASCDGMEAYGIIGEFDNDNKTTNYSCSLLRWCSAKFYNCVFRPYSGGGTYASLNYNNPDDKHVEYNHCVFDGFNMVAGYSGGTNIYVNNCATSGTVDQFPQTNDTTNEGTKHRPFNNTAYYCGSLWDADYKFNNPTDDVIGIHAGTYGWSAGSWQLVTVTDDFNDNSFDGVKWRSIGNGGGDVTESGGQLQITRDTNPGTWLYHTVQGRDRISNDFEFVVDVDRTLATINSSTTRFRGGIYVYNNGSSFRSAFENDTAQDWWAWTGLSSAFPDHSRTISGQPFFTTGKCKLSRSRGRISSYYDDGLGGGWRIISSSSATDGSSTIPHMFSQSQNTPASTQTTQFDNASITSNIDDANTPPSLLVEDFTRDSIHPYFFTEEYRGGAITNTPGRSRWTLAANNADPEVHMKLYATQRAKMTGDFVIEGMADFQGVSVASSADRIFLKISVDVGGYNYGVYWQDRGASYIDAWTNHPNGDSFLSNTSWNSHPVRQRMIREGTTLRWEFKRDNDSNWNVGGTATIGTSAPTNVGLLLYSSNGVTFVSDQLIDIFYLSVDNADGWS